jgi:hypothetical protein
MWDNSGDRAYGIPRVFDLKISWYGRLPLAFAVGTIGLWTRRYP